MRARRVWAPNAERVELVTGGRRIELAREPRGTFGGAGAEVPAGADYAFSLDGGPPLPDPRSLWQPAGVHGPSRRFDPGAFAWSDAGWRPPSLGGAVIYELHVGTFTEEGTFNAAIGRLDHLIELGITHLELMPIAEFPGARGWGYDGVDLFAAHHAYGGPHGLQRLVEACHARGLAVLLDVVYNHLGPSGNYLARFGPYFTDRYRTPWGPAVNLDGPGSDKVRRFLCDNALVWLRDFHIDGLRLDAVHAITDASATHFLEQLAGEVDELGALLGKRLVLIAESDLNDPRIVRPRELGGYGMDAQWSDDFHHALHVALTGERSGYYADFSGLADLARALESAFVFDGRYSAFRDRTHGRPPSGLGGERFLGYLQNHDQIGNRACGDRSSHLVSTGKLEIAAALVLLSPFIPLLFQGEEWGASTRFLYFTDHDDPELASAVSRGRREEFAAFGWSPEEVPDPQAAETFARSKLDWSELARSPHDRLLRWHRELIALRRAVPELRAGRLDRLRVRFDEQARWIALERGAYAVVCNLAEVARGIPLGVATERSVRLASGEAAGMRLESEAILLPAESAVVLGPPKDGAR